MLLTEFRQRYPQYDDLSDAELADGLYRKFYSDVPRFEFDQKIGLGVNAEPGWTGDPNAIAAPPDLTPRFPGGAGLPSVGFEMQQPEPLPQPAPAPMTPMTPMPSGPPATTGAVPVMPGLTQELDLDEGRWAVGGAGGTDFATSALPPIPAQGIGPFERFVSEWAPPQAPPQDALAPVPLPSDPYSGTPDWQGYPGLVARGAAETGLTMGRGLEALPQQQTDETRAFYDEYLTIQPGDRDTAEDLVRRVQRSGMTPTRKALFTRAVVQTVRDGSKVSSRDLGIDVPIDTATGERYDRAREVLRETFPASQEQEQSLLGKTATGFGSTFMFLPFAGIPGGVWAAGALAGAGEASERAYRAGASAEDQGTATTLGMVPGAIDALSVDSIIRGVTRTPGAAGWLRSIVLTGLRTGAIEGTTEGVQQAVQNVIARATYDPDAAIAEGVPENALVGFLSGGALGAAGGVFSRPDRSPVATMPDRQEPPALDPTRAAPGVPRGTEAERPAPDDAVAAAREARRQADEVMHRAAETRARNADRLGLLPDGSSPPVLPGPNDAQTFDRGSLPAGAQPGEAIIGPVEPAAPAPPAAETGNAEPEHSAQQRRPGETVQSYQRRLGVEPGTPEGDAAAAEWLRQFREQRDQSRQRQAEIDALPSPIEGESFVDYAARNGWQPGSPEYNNGMQRWSQARDEANARRSRDEKAKQDAESASTRARWAGRVHSWMESGQDGDTLSLPGAIETEAPLVLRVVHGTDRHGNPRTTRALMRPLPNGSEDLVVQSVNGVYQGGPDEKSMPMYGKALEESEAATTGMPAPAPIAPGVRVRIETPSGPAEGVVVEEFQEPRPEQPGAPGAVTAPAYAVQLDSGETVDVAPDRARIEVVEPARSVPEASANAMPEPAPASSEQANIEQTPSERAPATLAPEPAAVASADARTERGPSAPAAPRLSGPLQAARIIDSDTAITPAGTDVPVRYAVVEMDGLTPSQTDDGNPNPRFTGEQPRDRSRAASQAQVAEIASRLDPRRLDRNPSTADGAPLVGPDGMVDSGNGRILAIRRAYRQGLPSAYRYRQHLVEQGYPVEGMQRPVLVRINDAAPDMRARIASESNARSTLAMSATEQAMADARAMATILPTYRGGDVTAAVNRDFVRRFIDQAVGAGDRASVIDSQGQLSGPGIRRIQAAMLAAAYGDANIVEALVESADSDIKAIGGALVDAAPAWAQMRQEAEAGQIDPAVADVTKDLLEAVRLVQRARSEGQHVADLAAQMDMFGGRTISVRGEAFLRLFFRDLRYRSQRGRPRIAQALTYYATEARKTQPGPGLFGDADRATADGIIENARRQADGPDQQQGDLLGSRPARDGRDGEGLPPAGGDPGRGAPVQSPDGAGDRGPAAEPARGADAGGLPEEPAAGRVRGRADDGARYQVARSVETAPPFYSALTRAVEAVKIGRGPREQWLGIVRNLVQKGVKQAEIEWSGIETWLREVEGPITKDKVLDYLRSQEVQIKEINKDPYAPDTDDYIHDDPINKPKWAEYVLPGGEKYRELLLALPDKVDERNRAGWRLLALSEMPERSAAQQKEFDEVLRRYNELTNHIRAGGAVSDYKNPHFIDANILAHIRFNERAGPNGERVLFIEEIQSDWHQAGRKTGYSGRTVLTPEEREFDALMAVPRDERSRDQRNRVHVLTEDGTHASWLMKTRRTVPDAPLKATWHETAFRRAVRWAAENGFDRVAWTTGEQQVERFDLSKQISELTLHGTGNNLRLSATDHSGTRVIDMRHTTREGLADLIGKEPAERLLAQPEPTGPYSARRLSGLDLKVGGEGMRGFYDRILPAYANKFGKPFGARAETAPVSADGGDVAVHSLPVTPEMRESVMRDGVPLWQSGQEGTSPTTPLDPEALKAELRRIAPLASLEVIERIAVAGRGPMNGAYYPAFRGIVVAATGPDPMQTLRHEAIHALRDLNLIRPEEWRRLAARAEAEWIDRYDIETRYPSLSREGQIEEAVAEAFAGHAETPLPPGLRSVWENVRRFFERLGAWLRGQGFQTVEDVLGRIERGEVGARDVASGQGRGTAAAFQVPRVRGTTRQETAIDKAIEPTDLRGIGTRILEAVAATRERVSKEWRWALADDLDGIKRVAKAAGGVDRLDRELPAYVAARFARHHAGQVEAFLRYGAPEWNAAERMVAIKPGSRGLFQIIEPLQRAGLSRLFEGYAYARRVDSQGLIAQGRERNLTPGDVQELLDLAQKHPEFVTIFDEIQAYKKAFVDLAEATGLINAQQRQTWEQMDHIPFYRVAEEAGVKAPFSGKGLANQGPGIRRLTGGDQRFVVIESATGNVVARHVERADATADAQARGGGYTVETAGEPIPSVIENVARNVSHLLSSSMKNYAAHLAVADAITIGAAKRRPMGMKQALVPTAQIQAAAQAAGVNVGGWPPNQIQALWAIVPPSDPDVASVRVAGKQEFYEISDRLLLRALTALHETTLHPVMKALASVRSFFTRTITLDPGFMIRNFVRDSMAQWVQSDSRSLNFPLEMGRSLKNAMAAFRSDDRIKTIMAAGADTGFYANRPEQVKKQIETLKKNYKADLLSLTYNPKRWIEVLEKIGRASEMANRLATYDATMRKTGSQRDAAFEAMDALDFQMRPGSAWVQGFTAIVPFLNARIQGLYRLGRGLAANPKRFAAAGGMLAVFSTILALFNAEDDEEGGYNDLPEYIKDAAWIIPVWRLLGLAGADAWKWAEENDLPRFLMIPKPFEVGIIFGTVPERFVQALYGNDRAKDTIRSAAHAVMDTLAFNPLANPVSAVPLQWAFNHDFFRGQPIESRSVQNLPPGQRANASTGATARLVGEALDVSPAKMEMAVRGFFGTMGAYTLAAVDEVTAALSGQPPAIPRRWDQVPAIRSFIRQDPVASTKWTERFYDLRRQVNEAAAGVKEYEDRGETEKAARAEREAAPQLEERRGLNATGRSLAANRAAQDLLRNFERLPEAEKRAATREFASLFKEIAENPENRPVNLRLRNVAPKMRALSGKTELPPGAKRDIADAIIWSNNGLARSAAKEAEERIAAAKRKTSPSPSPSAKTSP